MLVEEPIGVTVISVHICCNIIFSFHRLSVEHLVVKVFHNRTVSIAW